MLAIEERRTTAWGDDRGISIGATLLVWALCLAVGCSKPQSPRWKEALDRGEVIRLKEPRSQEESTVLEDSLAAHPQVERFEIPPPPPLHRHSEKAQGPLASLGMPHPVRDPAVLSPEPLVGDVAAQVLDRPVTVSDEPVPDLTVDALVAQCRERYDELQSYTAKLIKHEQAGKTGKDRQSIRISVHCPSGRVLLEWLDTYRQGRKVVFDSDDPGSKVTIALGKREPRLMGDTLTVAPDHFLIRAGNRHQITSIGLQGWIGSLEQILQWQRAGDLRGGRVELIGRKAVSQCENRMMYLVRQYADERATRAVLPPGGHRDWHIDCNLLLPLHVIAHGPEGACLEEYLLTNLQLDPSLSESDVQLD